MPATPSLCPLSYSTASDLGNGSRLWFNGKNSSHAILPLNGRHAHVPLQLCRLIVGQNTVLRVGRLHVVAAQHNLQPEVKDGLGQAEPGLHSTGGDGAIHC